MTKSISEERSRCCSWKCGILGRSLSTHSMRLAFAVSVWNTGKAQPRSAAEVKWTWPTWLVIDSWMLGKLGWPREGDWRKPSPERCGLGALGITHHLSACVQGCCPGLALLLSDLVTAVYEGVQISPASSAKYDFIKMGQHCSGPQTGLKLDSPGEGSWSLPLIQAPSPMA